MEQLPNKGEKSPATSFADPKNYSQFLVYFIFILPLKYLFNLEIIGKEKIKIKKPLIAIANHQSMWDSFIVLSAMGLTNFWKMFPWRSPITKSLYRLPWVWAFAKLIGLYKIEPKGELDASLKDTLEFIDKSYSIFFFPQGRMIKKDEITEPKKGVGYICQKKDVNFLPVRIIYRGYNKKGRGKIWGAKIIFGELFDSASMRQKHESDKLHIAITDRIFAVENIGKPKSSKLTTEVIHAFSKEVLNSILKIEEDSFPPEWEYDDAEEYYTEILNNKNNIVIVLKKGSQIIGHILAKPHNDAVAEIKIDDPLLKEDKDRYYIETMAILPGYRGSYGYLDLTEKIIEEVKRRGTDKFSMHIRRANGLSKSFQKLFGSDVTELRFVDKWKWANGEPYDYIEAAYKKSLLRLRLMIWSYKIYSKIRKFIFKKGRK
jgi:1-acyl-sn-glycerol-3-phosphate acyltransferase